MKESTVISLKRLEELVRKIKEEGWHISDAYWEKEAKIISKLHAQFEKEEKALRMTSEMFHKPFDL